MTRRIAALLFLLALLCAAGCTVLAPAPTAATPTLIPLLTVAPEDTNSGSTQAVLPTANPAEAGAVQTDAPASGTAPQTEVPAVEVPALEDPGVIYGEAYDTKDEVASYLDAYGELPPNFIRKNDARNLGWDSSKGNLWDVAYGKSIGGDRFGNYEGLLPERKGRTYYECDIGYVGGFRGAERLIFSNDGLIYYTGNHYKSFTLLYGEE